MNLSNFRMKAKCLDFTPKVWINYFAPDFYGGYLTVSRKFDDDSNYNVAELFVKDLDLSLLTDQAFSISNLRDKTNSTVVVKHGDLIYLRDASNLDYPSRPRVKAWLFQVEGEAVYMRGLTRIEKGDW